jgi:hypothetical protein
MGHTKKIFLKKMLNILANWLLLIFSIKNICNRDNGRRNKAHFVINFFNRTMAPYGPQVHTVSKSRGGSIRFLPLFGRVYKGVGNFFGGGFAFWGDLLHFC